jgi:hypothetical protein
VTAATRGSAASSRVGAGYAGVVVGPVSPGPPGPGPSSPGPTAPSWSAKPARSPACIPAVARWRSSIRSTATRTSRR